MIKEISGTMNEKEMERAIDILVESATFEELENRSFDGVVIDKLVTIIHRAIEMNKGNMQVA